MQTSASSVVHFSLPENRFLRYSFERLLSTPASGFRGYTTGTLNNVGTSAHCWSSSPESGNANAGHLDFRAASVLPQIGNPRAYGFPVRCVQHLQSCFYKGERLKVNFAIEREQKPPQVDYAERERSQAPVGGGKG